MAVRQLDHVNVHTSRLAVQIAFYRDVLGMEVGPRPAFPFGGAWLYCGGRAVVHFVEVAAPPAPSGMLRLEHFAFTGDDLPGLIARLRATGVAYEEMVVEDFGIRQVHFSDPDGNHLHVDFPLKAAP